VVVGVVGHPAVEDATHIITSTDAETANCDCPTGTCALTLPGHMKQGRAHA
jgi:hypothetical protein